MCTFVQISISRRYLSDCTRTRSCIQVRVHVCVYLCECTCQCSHSDGYIKDTLTLIKNLFFFYSRFRIHGIFISFFCFFFIRCCYIISLFMCVCVCVYASSYDHVLHVYLYMCFLFLSLFNELCTSGYVITTSFFFLFFFLISFIYFVVGVIEKHVVSHLVLDRYLNR